MKIKNVMAWTNPFVWIAGIPLMAGIIVSAMFDGIVKKTSKIVSKVNKDLE